MTSGFAVIADSQHFYSVIQEDFAYCQSNGVHTTLKTDGFALLPEEPPQCNRDWMVVHKDMGRGARDWQRGGGIQEELEEK